MKKMFMAAGMAAVMTACGTAGQKAATDAGNPFLAEYSTPFGVPPFDLIKVEHYKEAS
jgi:peptidyl-dipeptidase Dcp